MRIRQVDFPPAVLEAQRLGRLVIFAGAGVSMDAPSNYPDFNALAAQVGGDSYPRQEDEAIDRYLGRLSAAGQTVHERVHRILSSPHSIPNLTHQALINIFKRPADLRIVTTNFDRHFTTTASDRFGKAMPEVFCAPALPLGSEFTGIIYLHGSVEKQTNRLILTDSDFGRAYITEGWATRFLERLFSHFVVLFVGYSHQDMLLSYLARGLTAGAPGPGRFALTPPNDDPRWKNLGITPIHYPLSAPPELPHFQLQIALTAWATQSQAGALAIEERIRNIVSSSGPLTSEDDDFLKDALSEISTLQFFTRHARELEWLHWIEPQPIFQRIFTVLPEYLATDRELASWFANQFATQHQDEALGVLQRNGGTLSPLLWQEILFFLWRNKIHGETLSSWVSLLLDMALPQTSDNVLEYIFSDCIYPDDQITALLLFEYLTRPKLRLKKSFHFTLDGEEPRKKTDVEIDCVDSDYWLRIGWDGIFAPNLGALARRLSPIVSFHLTTARRLLTSFGKVTETWDPLNHSRGMIESRVQDHLRNGFSMLIDAGAVVMRWACEHDFNWADALVTDWFLSESPLLRRLAIFGLAICTHVNADEKLRWFTEKRLLYKWGFKHENFLLMQSAYSNASPEARSAFLEEVVRQHKPDEDDRETGDYELFNVVLWLAKSNPNCTFASKLLSELKAKNPIFSERAHPDMDSWIGPVTYEAVTSPEAPLALLACDIDQLVTTIQIDPQSGYLEFRSKNELMHEIELCAQKSHEWGIKVAQAAQRQSNWTLELWQALLGAWRATDLSDNEWENVLKVLEASPAIYEPAMQPLISFFYQGVQHTTAPIPDTLIERTKNIADRLWVYVEKIESSGLTDQRNWLLTAINHPAGQLFEFYIHGLSRLERAKLLTDYLRNSYKQTFSATIAEVSLAAQLARVLLASQAYFLFNFDPEWTEQNILPLLDAHLDKERAKQCWHGYLYWGRWNDSMLTKMMHSYESMFSLIDNEDEEMQHVFCRHLANIAVYSSFNPVEHGWLFRFMATVKTEIRVMWASEMRSMIGGLDSDAKATLWQRWLKTYWQERLDGRPLPLSGGETAEMVEWVTDLGPVFPEGVDLVCKSPYPDFKQSMAYYPLAKSDLLKQYPDAFAELLFFLAAGEKNRPVYDLDQLYEAVAELVELIPKHQQLRPLCDELARLGVQGAANLAAKLSPDRIG
jgi:hypothetical protein